MALYNSLVSDPSKMVELANLNQPKVELPTFPSPEELKKDLDNISKDVEALSTSVRERTFGAASLAFIGGLAAGLTILCAVLGTQVGLPLNSLQMFQAGGVVSLTFGAVAAYKYVHIKDDQKREAQKLEERIDAGSQARVQNFMLSQGSYESSNPAFQLMQQAGKLSHEVEKTEVSVTKTLVMPFALGFAAPLIAAAA